MPSVQSSCWGLEVKWSSPEACLNIIDVLAVDLQTFWAFLLVPDLFLLPLGQNTRNSGRIFTINLGGRVRVGICPLLHFLEHIPLCCSNLRTQGSVFWGGDRSSYRKKVPVSHFWVNISLQQTGHCSCAYLSNGEMVNLPNLGGLARLLDIL